MAVNVYLNFDGNCIDAVNFYSEVFSAEKQKILTFGQAPQNPQFPLPEDAKNRIIHTYLDISGSRIMFSDIFPGTPLTAGNNISLTIMYKSSDEVKTVFNKLIEGGNVTMELQKTFFSECFGSVTDKFGILWQIGTEGGH
jgi:Uncharacterized protein conserved in bacteria